MIGKKSLPQNKLSKLINKKNIKFSALFLKAIEAEKNGSSKLELNNILIELKSLIDSPKDKQKSLASDFLIIEDDSEYVYTPITYAINHKCSEMIKLILSYHVSARNTTEFHNTEIFYKQIISSVDFDDLKDFIDLVMVRSDFINTFFLTLAVYQNIPIDEKYFNILNLTLSKTPLVPTYLLTDSAFPRYAAKHQENLINAMKKNGCKFSIENCLNLASINAKEGIFSPKKGFNLFKSLIDDDLIDYKFNNTNILNELVKICRVMQISKLPSGAKSNPKDLITKLLNYIEPLISKNINLPFDNDFLMHLSHLEISYDSAILALENGSHLIKNVINNNTFLMYVLQRYSYCMGQSDIKKAEFYKKIANYILDNFVDINLEQQDAHGLNALHLAAKFNDLDLYKKIKGLKPELENVQDKLKLKPLSYFKNIELLNEIIIKDNDSKEPYISHLIKLIINDINIPNKTPDQVNHLNDLTKEAKSILVDEKFNFATIGKSEYNYIYGQILLKNLAFKDSQDNKILVNIVNQCKNNGIEGGKNLGALKERLLNLSEILYNFKAEGNSLSIDQEAFLLKINQLFNIDDNEIYVLEKHFAHKPHDEFINIFQGNPLDIIKGYYLATVENVLKIYEIALSNILADVDEKFKKFFNFKNSKICKAKPYDNNYLKDYLALVKVTNIVRPFEETCFSELPTDISNYIFDLLLIKTNTVEKTNYLKGYLALAKVTNIVRPFEETCFSELPTTVSNYIFDLLLIKTNIVEKTKIVDDSTALATNIPTSQTTSLDNLAHNIVQIKNSTSLPKLAKALADIYPEKSKFLDLINSDVIQNHLKDMGLVEEDRPIQVKSEINDKNEFMKKAAASNRNEQSAKKRKVEKTNDKENIKPGKEEVLDNEVIQTQPRLIDILLIEAVKNGDFENVQKHAMNGANVFVRDEYDANLISIARNYKYDRIEDYLQLKQFYLLNNNNNNNNNNQLKLNDLLADDQEYMEVVLSNLPGEGSGSADNA